MGGDTLLLLVGVTSAIALALGLVLLRLPARGLRQAGMMTLEIVGFCLLFLIANVGIGMTFAIVMRGRGSFVPLYAMGDIVLMLFSATQGVVFAMWRRTASRE